MEIISTILTLPLLVKSFATGDITSVVILLALLLSVFLSPKLKKVKMATPKEKHWLN